MRKLSMRLLTAFSIQFSPSEITHLQRRCQRLDQLLMGDDLVRLYFVFDVK